MIRYIYEIKNKINGKTYIGKHSTKNMKDSYMGSGILIAKAIKKYGIENFEKRILIQGNFTLDEINKFEKCAIAFYKVNKKAEYNIAKGGDGGQVFWGTGFDTKEERHKLGVLSYKGRLRKEQENPGYIRNIIEKSLKTKHQNLLNGKIFYAGKNNGMFGKAHSEETKKKMSENHKGEKNSSFGKHWYTNGIEEVKSFNCPNGWWPGRLSSKIGIDKKVFKKLKEEERLALRNKKLLEKEEQRKNKLKEKQNKLFKYKCIETEEVLTAKEWLEKGIKNLPRVADTNWTSGGFHFIKM